MPINIASYLLPRAGNTYALLEDVYLKGGFRLVGDLSERNAIDPSALKEGMWVVTKTDGKIYVLSADLTTWTEKVLSGGSGSGPVGPTGPQGVQGAQGIQIGRAHV